MRRPGWSRDELALVAFVFVVALVLVGVAVEVVANGGAL